MTDTKTDLQDEPIIQATNPWREMATMFFRNYAAVAGLILLTAILLFVFIGPIFHPVDPFEMVWAPFTTPMQDGFLLGTDYLGRDILSAMMAGGQVSLAIGLAAALVSVVIGVSVGAFAGYYGGVVEELLMRFTEFFQVLPTLLFSMVIVALFGGIPVNRHIGDRRGQLDSRCARDPVRILAHPRNGICGSRAVRVRTRYVPDLSRDPTQRLAPDCCSGKPDGRFRNLVRSRP